MFTKLKSSKEGGGGGGVEAGIEKKKLFALTLILVLNDNIFDTLTVKQCEIMINDDVLLYSATNEETPCQQLLHYWQCLELLT